MEEFNKMDALKYLVEMGPEYTNEWTEAGMYNILCKVINSDEEIFTKNILDVLLKEATNY
jgi:hypothetical protein